MNSIEKINQLIRDYSGPPDPNSEGLELAIKTAIVSVGPMFIGMLPEDPQDLDAGLEQVAMQLLELRSDGARPLQLLADVDGQPVPVAREELPAGEST